MDHDSGSRTVARIQSRQFTILLVSTVVIALFFVFVALSLYRNSGAMHLDLSRPGYNDAREEVTKTSEVYEGFTSVGSIDESSLKEFDTLYDEKAKEATAIDAFSGDALSDKTLGLTTSE